MDINDFRDELERIEDEEIRTPPQKRSLEQVPPYFWGGPASPAGKYYAEAEREQGGTILLSKGTARIDPFSTF